MIRISWHVATLTLMGLFFVQLVEAQPGSGRGPGFGRQVGGIVSLAGIEAVQKELGLTDDDAIAVRKVSEAYRQEQRDEFGKLGIGDFQSLQSLTTDERQSKLREISEKTGALAKKLDEKYAPQLKTVLKPEQFRRVQEISRQAQGLQAFFDPEVIKTLELSKEQQDKLAVIRDEYVKKQQSLFNGDEGSDIQDRFTKVRELSRERDAKAAEVLTKDQVDKFEKLKGKPFDLSQLRGGRSFRGDRQPRKNDEEK